MTTRGIKRKGYTAETAVVDLARRSGWPHAERRRLNGIHDRGDVAGMPSIVVEVKSGARLDLPGWLRETEAERRADGAEYGLLVVKPSGVGEARVGDWWAVMPLGDMLALLAQAGYGDGPALRNPVPGAETQPPAPGAGETNPPSRKDHP